MALCQREESGLYLLYEQKTDPLVKRAGCLSLSLISKVKRMALSSSELRQSLSTFEREEIGPRLPNDKRVVLSSLKRTRWLWTKVRRVRWPLSIFKIKESDTLVKSVEWLSLCLSQLRKTKSGDFLTGDSSVALYFRKKEIGRRLSNDKRVALSSLRKRRWPY